MFVQTSKKVLESGGLSYKLLGNFIGISVYTDLKYLKMEDFLIKSLEILLGSVFIQT